MRYRNIQSGIIGLVSAGAVASVFSGGNVRASDRTVPTGVGAFLEQCYEDSVRTVFSASDPFAYIRKSPDSTSDYVGKLYKGSAASVLSRSGGWLRVKSGEVEGYIRKEELITGSDALDCAEQMKSVSVRVETEVLNVRKGAGIHTPVIAQVTAGASYPAAGEETDGWIPVEVDGKKGFLSADYVTLDTDFTYAEPKEEKPAAEQKGKEVVDYACGFLGNPYVWGGTSLTDGADCSGFVQSVYRAFGVELPRTTWDMEQAGREVSVGEMLPGDIILYDGHVGIYMGDDKIINAIDEEHGIGISPAFFTDVITIRRIVG